MVNGDIRHTFVLLQHMFHMVVVQLVWFIAIWEVVWRKSRREQIYHGMWQERERVTDELKKQIIGSEIYWDIIHMDSRMFLNFFFILLEHSGLWPKQRATVEEQVAKFLYFICHNVWIRAMSFFFRQSNETIMRHFHMVLIRGLIELEAKYMRQPNGGSSSRDNQQHKVLPIF